MGDTSRSAAMFRVFFSSRVNVMITKSSVEFYEHVERFLGGISGSGTWDIYS